MQKKGHVYLIIVMDASVVDIEGGKSLEDEKTKCCSYVWVM